MGRSTSARTTTASAALASLRGKKPVEKPRRSPGDLDARWPGGGAPLGTLDALPAVDDVGPRSRGDAADPIQVAEPLGAAATRRSSGREVKAARVPLWVCGLGKLLDVEPTWFA